MSPVPLSRERFLPLFEEDNLDQYSGWGLFGRVTDNMDLLQQVADFTRTFTGPPRTATA